MIIDRLYHTVKPRIYDRVLNSKNIYFIGFSTGTNQTPKTRKYL